MPVPARVRVCVRACVCACARAGVCVCVMWLAFGFGNICTTALAFPATEKLGACLDSLAAESRSRV